VFSFIAVRAFRGRHDRRIDIRVVPFEVVFPSPTAGREQIIQRAESSDGCKPVLMFLLNVLRWESLFTKNNDTSKLSGLREHLLKHKSSKLL
jgi:hypothetical protein